jgi:hypothetical protein
MKYFIDTEFLEGTQKENFPISLFRKNTPPTIDLISIGIVAEDGREYYAISKDFNLKEAWNRWQQRTGEGDRNNTEPRLYWIRENVLKPIFHDLHWREERERGQVSKAQEDCIKYGGWDDIFTYSRLENLISRYGKTNKEIAADVKHFCSMGTAYSSLDRSTCSVMYFSELDKDTLAEIKTHNMTEVYNEVPEFYAYYADYDWVAFCWLFGKMMDLPNGFPMYCIDLKQSLDEKLEGDLINKNQSLDPRELVEIRALKNKDKRLNWLKQHSRYYPKQENEHNALADARWNKKLYEFLSKL